MEQTDIFPKRIRWVAIATGVASALALFPILFLLYPTLLIVGGIIQPRFPSTGRWLVWAGAANLGVVLITYDLMLFPHPLLQPYYMMLIFPVSTILLAWCSAELIADGLKRMRTRRSVSSAEPRPVSWGAWIVAVVLNLLIGWYVYSLPSWPRHSGHLYTFGAPLVQGVIVVAFDISLIRRVVRLRSARRANLGILR